jgi:hypothetical protein
VPTAGPLLLELEQGAGVGLPLARQDSSGRLTRGSIAELEALMARAAAQHNFRVATQLQCMMHVLGPAGSSSNPQDNLARYTSSTADEAADLLLEHGFVLLPNVVGATELGRMRSAYESVADGYRRGFEELWTAGLEPRRDMGKNFKFPMFEAGGGHPAFYPLLDPPLLLQVVHRVTGRFPVVSALNEGLGGFVIPANDGRTPHEEAGYISWHRDQLTHYAGWPFPSARSIKASCYLYDVDENGAPLTVVPGSHRLPNPPQRTLEGVFQGGRGHYIKPDDVTSPQAAHLPRGVHPDGLPRWIADASTDLPSLAMPNAVQCTVPAGTMVVWDNNVWHTATPNTSGRERVGHICGFGAITERLGGMEVPLEHLAVLQREGQMGAWRKAAFGMILTAQEEEELTEAWEAAERWVARWTGGQRSVGAAGPPKANAAVSR